MLIFLLCYPISGHHFLWMEPQCWVRNGVVQWAKCTRWANDGSLKSQRARSFERTSPHNCSIFFCPTRCSNLKQFSEITLEFWRPLTSTSFELDFVYHIPKVPYFPFPKAKDPNFCKYLRQQYFKKHGRLARKSHYFWSYILFWWTSKRVSQFLKPGNGESLGNTGVLLMVTRHDNF